ncbi:MAG: beta-galactosidase, partial [Bacteroidales bacterium]|nr:beta-galactosidase [Bacteroidales bacterium]
LQVECGVNRVLVRTTTRAGKITLTAKADGVKSARLSVKSVAGFRHGSSSSEQGLLPRYTLPGSLMRGPTPLTPSYQERRTGVKILSATAGCHTEQAVRSFDDNELSEWKNDGRLFTAWIQYRLERKAIIDDICLKLTGWRLRSYPLEIYAGDSLIWSGNTERSLGYIHLTPTHKVCADEITIRLKGAGQDEDAFGGIVEVAEPAAGELDLFKARNGEKTKNELRIVEVEFLVNG